MFLGQGKSLVTHGRAAASPTVVRKSPTPGAHKQKGVDTKRERVRSLIADDVIIHGTMRLRHGVKLDGSLVGDLHFGTDNGLAIIGKFGVLNGNLFGPKALIFGTVIGDVRVVGKLVIGPEAAIMGKIECGLLVVMEGAKIVNPCFRAAHTNEEGSGEPSSEPEVQNDIDNTATAVTHQDTKPTPATALVRQFPAKKRHRR